jgi:hypothetical protein
MVPQPSAHPCPLSPLEARRVSEEGAWFRPTVVRIKLTAARVRYVFGTALPLCFFRRSS